MHIVLVGGTGIAFGVEWLLRLRGRADSAVYPEKIVFIDNAQDDKDEFNLIPLLEELAKGICPIEAMAAADPAALGSNEAIWTAVYGVAERDQGVKTGFFADPKLGSVLSIRDGLLLKLGRVAGLYDGVEPVLVVGSIIGGTGAGLLPLLGKHFAEKAAYGVRIIAFLPWFNPDLTPRSVQQEGALGPTWERILRNCVGGLDKLEELVQTPPEHNNNPDWQLHVYVAGIDLKLAAATRRPTRAQVAVWQSVSPALAAAASGWHTAFEEEAHHNEAQQKDQTALLALVDRGGLVPHAPGLKKALGTTLRCLNRWNYSGFAPLGTVDANTWAPVFGDMCKVMKRWKRPVFWPSLDEVKCKAFWQSFQAHLLAAAEGLSPSAGAQGAGGAQRFGEDAWIAEKLKKLPPIYREIVARLTENASHATEAETSRLTALIVHVLVAWLRREYEGELGETIPDLVLPALPASARIIPTLTDRRKPLPFAGVRASLQDALPDAAARGAAQPTAPLRRAMAGGIHTQPYASPLGAAHATLAALRSAAGGPRQNAVEATALLWRGLLHGRARRSEVTGAAARLIAEGELRAFVTRPATLQIDGQTVGSMCLPLGLVPHVHRIDPEAGKGGPVFKDEVIQTLVGLEYALACPRADIPANRLLTHDEGWTLRDRLEAATDFADRVALLRAIEGAEQADKATLRHFAETHRRRLRLDGVADAQVMPPWLQVLLLWTESVEPRGDWIPTATTLEVIAGPKGHPPTTVQLPARCSVEARALLERLSKADDARLGWPGATGGEVTLQFGDQQVPLVQIDANGYVKHIHEESMRRYTRIALAQNRALRPRIQLS